MDMVLLDWTRMGRSYCLAGAVPENGKWRVVRPLLRKHRSAPVRNVGWSPYLLDGHSRWEVFELIDPQPAPPEPPHLEDLWVRAMRPRRAMATPGQRRTILEATTADADGPLFGSSFCASYCAAFLEPGSGTRSLATVCVPSREVRFSAVQRGGMVEADVRVALPVPGLAGRLLPMKDHHLLQRAEQASPALDGRLKALQAAVGQMGERVAVRLGLTRPFSSRANEAGGRCWLMADGFFSWTDPQP